LLKILNKRALKAAQTRFARLKILHSILDGKGHQRYQREIGTTFGGRAPDESQCS
jgi:hypothetical protein